MSYPALAWAWPQQGLDPTAKLLLVKLADQANDAGVCWPAKATLAYDIGVSESTIRRILKGLAASGLLVIERREAESGRQKSNLYRLALDFQTALDAARGEGGVDAPPEGGAGAGGEGGVDAPPVLRTEPPEGPSLAGARKRDLVWDVLAELFGDPAPSERSDFGKTVKEVKANLHPEPGSIDWSSGEEWIRREIEGRVDAMGEGEYRSHRSLRTRWTALGRLAAGPTEGDTAQTAPREIGEPASCPSCPEFWDDHPNSFDPDCPDCGGTGRAGWVL